MSCMQGLMGEMKEARKQLVHQVLSLCVVFYTFEEFSFYASMPKSTLGGSFKLNSKMEVLEQTYRYALCNAAWVVSNSLLFMSVPF